MHSTKLRLFAGSSPSAWDWIPDNTSCLACLWGLWQWDVLSGLQALQAQDLRRVIQEPQCILADALPLLLVEVNLEVCKRAIEDYYVHLLIFSVT